MDDIFFWLSKILWTLVSPDGLLLVLVLLAWLTLMLNWQRAARRLLTITSLPLLILAFFPLGEWLLLPLESRFQTQPPLPEEVHGIVVLGGAADPLRSAIWQQPQLQEGADRITQFLALSLRFPEARALFSGGSGSTANQQYREAFLLPVIMHDLGFDPDRFLFESESRNTRENAEFSHRMVSPQPGENWLLITSAFHMPRSVGIFCSLDWPVIPWPVDHRTRPGHLLRPQLQLAENLYTLHTAVREWIGLFTYRLTGRSAVLWPSDGSCS